MLSCHDEQSIRRHERHLVATLAQAHIADGDLIALQRFIRDHGTKAAQRGLALFVGYLSSFDLTDAEEPEAAA